ncbi:MAG: nucleoside phosphorylase [Propionibacteriaceae bacterium]|jgi:uridine phosphorylase|nr:nucleoside phosphorylase [Propionibacteriaceae bacterium]
MITETFDPTSPEVITAGMFIDPIEDCPATAIVTFQQDTMRLLLSSYPSGQLTLLSFGMSIDVDVQRVASDGNLYATCLSPIGGPAAVAVLEDLIACGVKRFVVFGSCGVLIPGVAAGRLIVPNEAVRDEGTSYHYAPASETIALTTAPELAGILDEIGAPYVTGMTWTTDAFYRETRALVDRRVKQGCVAVEMEAASLAAMSQLRGVDVYHFLYAADSLEGEWDRRIPGHVGDEPQSGFIRVALAVAKALEEKYEA